MEIEVDSSTLHEAQALLDSVAEMTRHDARCSHAETVHDAMIGPGATSSRPTKQVTEYGHAARLG